MTGALHDCPRDGCTERVPYTQLACRAHWMSLAKTTRDRVNAAWTSGDRAYHRAAMVDAILEMNQ